jgi:hypothetical protein
MAEYNTVARVGGLLKRVYGKDVVSVVPNNTEHFFSAFPFQGGAERIGEKFFEAVNLGVEQGLTTASGTAGIVTLNDAEAPAIKQAEVDGYQIINRAWIAWDTITRAEQSNSPQAFRKVFDQTIENLRNGHRRRQVMNMLYGGENLGEIASGVNGATQTLTEASNAPGVWFASNGLTVDIYSSDLSTKRATVKVSGYDASNPTAPTVTFSAAVNTTTGDVIVPAGVVSDSANTEAKGLSAILGETSSLFGISLSSYSSFAPSQYNADGEALNQAKLDEAASLSYMKGFSGKLILFCSGYTFNDLHTEQVSRVMTRGYGPENNPAGLRGLGYRIQGDIIVDVVSSPWIKSGEAYLVPDDGSFKRIGTEDLKLGAPYTGSSAIVELHDKSGLQAVSYSLNAMFTSKPFYGVKITGIQNTYGQS